MTIKLNHLLELARDGDSQAEEELFQYLSVRFRRLAVRRLGNVQDAEEVVQEALTAISKDYRDVEFSKSFAAWAHKVLDFRILSYFSSNRKRDLNVSGSTNVEELVDRKGSQGSGELLRKLLECLRMIGSTNKRYARILNLYHQGYSTQEVSSRLNVSVGNCYMLLSRSRAQLRKCLESGGSTDG